MNSILEEFAKGNISPEPRFYSKDSDYGRKMKELSDIQEDLLASLSEEQKKLLNDLNAVQAQICSLSSVDKFIYGYRLGTLMTMEVFVNKENLLANGEIK